MSKQDIRFCAIGALLATLALWFTGIVTVPFANGAARHWLAAFMAPTHPAFEGMVYQLENIIYAIGRVPLLFAVLLALSMYKKPEGTE